MSKSKKIFAIIMFTIMLINTVFSTPKTYAASKDKPKWINSDIVLKVGDEIHKPFFADKYGNAIPSKRGKWSSGNKKVATVSKHGVITAKKQGKTKIKIKYHRTYYIEVTVYNKKNYKKYLQLKKELEENAKRAKKLKERKRKQIAKKRAEAKRKAEEEAKKALEVATEINTEQTTEIETSTEINTEQSTEAGSTEMEKTENTETP